MSAASGEDYKKVLERHARTFHAASLLLPEDTREDSALLYAFCRFVDDTADEATDQAEARAALLKVAHQLQSTQHNDTEPHGPPTHTMLADIRTLFSQRSIPIEAALELIEGVLGDLTPELILPDDAALLRYCYRVAGVVGVMMCGALRVQNPAALAHAIDLGIGMQLTNICRDVLEDAQLARIYLPATRLRAARLTPHECLTHLRTLSSNHLHNPRNKTPPPRIQQGLQSVVHDLLTLAERYYDSAQQGFRYLPARVRPAIIAAGWMYRAIGRTLLSRQCRVWEGRTVVPQSQKLYWISRALLAAPLAYLWRQPHDPALHIHLHGLPGANHIPPTPGEKP